ncbi:9175_t:CDS:2, partial [Racocetra fulgida]
PTIEDDRVRYNVILKSKSDWDKHYEWLKNNLGRTIGKSTQSILSITNKNYVKDFSVDAFYGYTAWFTQEFASKKLKQRDEVAVVEKDFIMKTNYVVPRDVQNTIIPNRNLDRIDQADSVLDGEYEFPDTAVVSAVFLSVFDISALSGTSQAAPFVAGTLALIIAND